MYTLGCFTSDFHVALIPDDNYLVRQDPVELCGYSPCKVTKCVTGPAAMCVSDSQCRPVFFDQNGKIIKSCKGKRRTLVSLDRLP